MTNTQFAYSRETLENTMRQMQWIEYEIDPEWGRFCSFGPDDIGTVWEDIGVIRKRPRYTTVVIFVSLAVHPL